MQPTLILASGSPRRKELLEVMGFPFHIYAADIDETPLSSENPTTYVARMAKAKAYAACEKIAKLSTDLLEGRALILGSDTSVVLGNRIFGKPQTEAEFTEVMGSLSGQTHHVITSVHIIETIASEIKSEKACSVLTKVKFKTLTHQEILGYWRTGEPLDKAGGYGIQGRGALFIERISGSYSAVVGLPVKETSGLLEHYGLNIWAES